MKTEISKGWQGYEIQTVNPMAPKFHMYVKKIYGGRVEWVTDFTHSKKYKTEKAAREIARKIEQGEIISDL